MTYVVVVGRVVQALFGPVISVDPAPAFTRFPPEAHRFALFADALQRADELPRAVVREVWQEREL